MIRTLILSCGYVEDTTYPKMICTHFRGFKTFKEAVASLGAAAKKIAQEPRTAFKTCCEKKRKKKDCPAYCDACGAYLESDSPKVTEEDIRNLVDDMWSATYANSTELLSDLQDQGWIFWVEGNPFKKPQEVVVVRQNAEAWIAWATEVEMDTTYLDPDEVTYLNGKPVETGYVEEDM